jgi:ribosomal protein S3
LFRKFGEEFEVVVKEIAKPELSARIMAEYVASQIEKRLPYRRVSKFVLDKVMKAGAR